MAVDVAAPWAATVDHCDIAETLGNSTPSLLQAGDESKIRHFQSQAEAIESLKQMAVEHWNGWFGKPWQMYLEDRLSFQTNLEFGGNLFASAVRNTGNVQTIGVDEADNAVFSNDGYVFVFRDRAIRIIDIRDPKNLKEVSRIDLTSTSASMHLVGNRLVVISQGYEAQTVASFSHPNVYTQVKFFDVAEKDAPVSTGGFNIDGTVNVARIANGKLVLVQHTRDAILQLQSVNPNADSLDRRLTAPPNWSSRYETKQEYLDRITPTLLNSVLLQYQEIGKDGKVVSEGVVGDWRDVAAAGGNQLTSVVSIDLNGESPKIESIESVLGSWAANTYVTENSIYWTSFQSDGITRITHLDLGNGPTKAETKSPRGVTARAIGDIKGTIRNSRFMDEYDGYLRVVANEDGSNSGGRIRNSASVFVMKLVDGELKTVGSLLDISPGDQAFGAEFDGPRAFITTGFIDPITIRPIDPLHGIDLSDPTHPKELSDVIIPGITNYVQWVDSNHLLGIGMVEEQSQWFTQVSLYDVTDLSDPKTLDVWRGTTRIQPNVFGSINPLDIHYDSQSKTLTIPEAQSQEFNPWWNPVWSPLLIDVDLPIGNPPFWNPNGEQNRSMSDVIVLAVDLEADDPLSFRAVVGDGSGMGRAVVVGESLVALTRIFLSTYAINAPTNVVDRILLANPLRPDAIYFPDGAPKTIINVLENDFRLEDFKITAIRRGEVSGSHQGVVRILPDQTLEYTSPTLPQSEIAWWDNFYYEVTTDDGHKFETQVSVWGVRSNVSDPVQGSATISARAVDANNQPVTAIGVGDEFWVEVLLQDGRSDGQGVFSAYVDLAFDTNAFEIVGPSEPLGVYTNRVSGERTVEGWKNLGGFSNSPTPIGSSSQPLVRFKLRATADAALNMTISSSTAIGSELTLYGIDSPIPIENISFHSLQLPQRLNASASISLKAYDAENNPVTSTAKGDEFWVEVTMQDGRPNGQGVYSAYVDLAFDTKSFEIVGDAEALGGFTNKLSGVKTPDGWSNLGGFRDSASPAGSVAQSLVRFKIRAKEDAVLDMMVIPSNLQGSEVTLYGIDTVIPIANITSSPLRLPMTVLDYDVNADGLVSPIDSLIVINRLNREGLDGALNNTIAVNSSNETLDVNNDGIISLLDALTLINRINRDNVIPMMNSIETNDIAKKK